MIYVFKEIFTGKIRRVSGLILAGMITHERIFGFMPRYRLSRVILPKENISISAKSHLKIQKVFGIF